MDLLAKLRIGVDEHDRFQLAIDKEVSDNDMERCVDIEADEEITTELCSDFAENIERSEDDNVQEDIDVNADAEEAKVETVASELPYLVESSKCFARRS